MAVLEGEFRDRERKIHKSLKIHKMHLKGRAPGKVMASLDETKAA